MAQQTNDKTIFTLYQVARSIQKNIAERYKSAYWIKAEMNKLNHYSHSGHAYPELVEKRDGTVIAEMRSIIWRDDFQRINNLFLKILKEPLKDGISILISAQISYDPKYGLSLRIIDIDPSYSLGELEKEKLENIATLKKEGIYGSNKLIPLAVLPKRLAIISVNTSKGYADFLNIIERNASGFKFFHMLFPAILQGEKAVMSILNQLANIRKVKHHFDAVAIIRGGGGDVGLSCYNDLNLSRVIAGFPMPVFTGIGHSTNETVAELVSHTNAITPTDLAGLLLQKFNEFETSVLRGEKVIIQLTKQILKEQNLAMRNLGKQFMSYSKAMLQQRRNDIKYSSRSIMHESVQMLYASNIEKQSAFNSLATHLINLFAEKKSILKQLVSGLKKDVLTNIYNQNNSLGQWQKNMHVHAFHLFSMQNKQVDHFSEKVNLLSPDNVLKRGYSITKLNGETLISAIKILPGDLLTTILFQGSIHSLVTETDPAVEKPG
ncbi:MAG: exodeoxyribonuclease VII large subunit [Chitinophagaceae bacterium]